MNKLSALIKNFNMDCHKQYTKVSGYLGDMLDDSLKNIEKFYYSDFWANRFRKRLKEEGFRYYPLELDCILGSISYLREETKFQLFVDESDINGKSDNGTAISLNVNSDKSNVDNIIMHRLGHPAFILKVNRLQAQKIILTLLMIMSLDKELFLQLKKCVIINSQQKKLMNYLKVLNQMILKIYLIKII